MRKILRGRKVASRNVAAGDEHEGDFRLREIGGRTWTRTTDPLIKSQLLYQLSYAPAEGLTCIAVSAAGLRDHQIRLRALLIAKLGGSVQQPS